MPFFIKGIWVTYSFLITKSGMVWLSNSQFFLLIALCNPTLLFQKSRSPLIKEVIKYSFWRVFMTIISS